MGGFLVDNKLNSKLQEVRVYIRKGSEYYGVVGKVSGTIGIATEVIGMVARE